MKERSANSARLHVNLSDVTSAWVASTDQRSLGCAGRRRCSRRSRASTEEVGAAASEEERQRITSGAIG